MLFRISLLMLTAMFLFCLCESNQESTEIMEDKTHVLISTNQGEIEVELNRAQAPVSVNNFLEYVKSKFYDKTIFHRVIADFMIQGGGFTEDLQKKQTRPAIPYEGGNGLSNVRGTIAYARTADPNSATSQFFINHRDNLNLDHGNTPNGYGYTVFGHVVSGMDAVDRIALAQTGSRPNGMRNVPVKSVIIDSIRVVESE